MKKPRRFTVREKTFGLNVEFYCGTPQRTALRRCVAILQLDPNDPDNAPDDSDAAWAMCYGSQAVVWVECCAALDRGEDPREMFVGDIVEKVLQFLQAATDHNN